MTQAADNLQSFLAASWAGYGKVVGAWTDAVMQVYKVVAEWAVEEKEYLKFGESDCFVRVAVATELIPEIWSATDAGKQPLPVSQVTVTPSQLPAMADDDPPVRVVVKVHGGSGAYVGRLVDASGAVVEPDIYVSLG